MKRIKIITSVITLASMFAGIAPAYAVDSVTITPKTALASAKLNARVEPSGSNVTYQWVSGDSESGPFTPIYKANDAQYVYSTLDKGKYVTVEVTDKDTGEIFQSSDVRIAA